MDMENKDTLGEGGDRLLDLIDRSALSGTGMKRVHTSIDLMGHWMGITSQMLAMCGELHGMTCIMLPDTGGSEGLAEVVISPITSDEGTSVIRQHLNKKTDEKSYDAVITIAEAWCTGKMGVRAGDDPDRKEVVITNLHLNIGFQPCVLTVMQPIIRDNDGVSLGECDTFLSQGQGVTECNLFGFEKNLCPIT